MRAWIALTALGLAGCYGDGGTSLGKNHTCTLVEDGVACWGWNARGQAGAGSAASQPSPALVLVGGLESATQVVMGGEFSCAIVAGGEVRCWGDNALRQVRDTPSESAVRSPVGRGITDAVHIALGATHGCAALSTGRVACWGSNEAGQAGAALTESVRVTEVENVTDALQVAAGRDHSCALRATGEVMCWGSDVLGQLGDGAPSTASSEQTDDGTTPAVNTDHAVTVSGLSGATWITAGDQMSCAVASGSVLCWGGNGHGELRDREAGSAAPVAVSVGAVEVQAGEGFVCARTEGGKVSCWGWNAWGQAGQGSTEEVLPPREIGLDDVTRLMVGGAHACAATTAGEVYCWGDNSLHALGDGTTQSRTSPTRVNGLP